MYPPRLISIFLLIIVATSGLAAPILAQDGPPPGCIYVQQDEGFEADGVWQFTETQSQGFFDATVAHRGERSAFVGVAADAENQQVDSTVWQEMRLPLAEQITATMWFRAQTGDENDNRYIVVWDLESNESTVLLYELVEGEDWQEKQVDLTSFAGRRILLVAGVHNDGANLKAGAWVDDAYVVACGLQETPPSDNEPPTPTPTPTLPSPTIPAATATPTPLPPATPTPPSPATPTAAPSATPTPLPAVVPPTHAPTLAPTFTPALSPTPTSPPPPVEIEPEALTKGHLPDNNSLPLIAGIFLSVLVAVLVVVFNLRR